MKRLLFAAVTAVLLAAQGFAATPDELDAIATRGNEALAAGHFKDGEAKFRQATKLDPHNGYFCLRLAYALVRQGKRAEALQVLKQGARTTDADHKTQIDDAIKSVTRTGTFRGFEGD